MPCPALEHKAEDKDDEVMQFRYGATADQQKPAALAGSVAQITDKVGQYVAAGADWIIVALRPPYELDELAIFAEQVMPHFA